jgi:hypothetical protein
VTEKRIIFEEFEFPIKKGFQYLVNEKIPKTDFLIVNDRADNFSMTFEKDFPIFTVPESSDRDYCLFEIKLPDRKINFYCPEKRGNISTAVWYFYVNVFDEKGVAHTLPGQVRVDINNPYVRMLKGKPPFLEVLESVRLSGRYA